MSIYAHSHHQIPIYIHSEIYENEDWSNTPSLSFTTTTNSTTSSPVDNLSDLPTTSHDYTHWKLDKMEDSWMSTPLPESPCTDMGAIAPHGLSGHRRGPSELESTMWDTAQINGELGLAPVMSVDAKAAAGLKTLNLTSTTTTTTTTKSGHGHGAAPLPIAVWAKIMDTSKGRDKVLVRSLDQAKSG